MMRVPAVSVAILLIFMAFLPLGTFAGGGVDPRVPADLYGRDDSYPLVVFRNTTIEAGTVGELPDLEVTLNNFNIQQMTDDIKEFNVALEIYRWGGYDLERELEDLGTPLPMFTYFDEQANDTVESLTWRRDYVWHEDTAIEVDLPDVTVPDDASHGFYRVRVALDLYGGDDAMSMGHFTEQQWRDNVGRVQDHEAPVGADYLVSEGGFTVVPQGFLYVSQPNKVPDLGDFTTPVIRPGERGTYNFTVTNRYNLTITDVFVTVEFYMWATIEESKPIEDLDGPVPVIRGIGEPSDRILLPDIDPGGTEPIKLEIVTGEDTPKGTYFVRHRIEFQYGGQDFTMDSRGFFTWDQWEGFDYTNLYYQLGTSGIVPDSSFSVKDPVPLWPLATLIALCVLLGVLAVVFYLAEEHGEQYPRLKKGIQFWSGRYQQRKRLLQQRLDDIRADQEAEDDLSGDGEDGTGT